jgi:hypothetical protein
MEEKKTCSKSTFYLSCYVKKSNALRDGKVPIYLKITVNKRVAAVSLQATVLPNLWDSAKEKSRAKDKSAIELNNYINSAKAKITTMYRELELDGKPITAQLLKDMYPGNHKDEEKGKTLVEIHSDHNERCRKLLGVEYSQSTIYKFDTSLKYLIEFMSVEMSIEDIPLKNNYDDILSCKYTHFDFFLKYSCLKIGGKFVMSGLIGFANPNGREYLKGVKINRPVFTSKAGKSFTSLQGQGLSLPPN